MPDRTPAAAQSCQQWGRSGFASPARALTSLIGPRRAGRDRSRPQVSCGLAAHGGSGVIPARAGGMLTRSTGGMTRSVAGREHRTGVQQSDRTGDGAQLAGFSGGGEIRTLGTPLRRTTVFETAAFNRSATPPDDRWRLNDRAGRVAGLVLAGLRGFPGRRRLVAGFGASLARRLVAMSHVSARGAGGCWPGLRRTRSGARAARSGLRLSGELRREVELGGAARRRPVPAENSRSLSMKTFGGVASRHLARGESWYRQFAEPAHREARPPAHHLQLLVAKPAAPPRLSSRSSTCACRGADDRSLDQHGVNACRRAHRERPSTV
jgi:hypothetical protein